MKISIDHLSKSYGDQIAVDDLSFSVDTGEILGFLGPNGAGKTTTMKMITNYLVMDSGEIRIGDLSVQQNGAESRKHIGYLPENNPLYLDMPVIDYLTFCGQLQGMNREQINLRTREMVSVCGINKEKHKKIGELSKGYRQRVGLAQAMIHDPAILILDEPTTGLDPNQIVEIRNLIREVGQEKTVILSTHILPEVEATCDRILIINRGKIVADGTAESLKRQASGKILHRVRIDGPGLEKLTDLLLEKEGMEIITSEPSVGRYDIQSIPVVDFPRELFLICEANQWIIRELTPTETSLEDIFRGLTI